METGNTKELLSFIKKINTSVKTAMKAKKPGSEKNTVRRQSYKKYKKQKLPYLNNYSAAQMINTKNTHVMHDVNDNMYPKSRSVYPVSSSLDNYPIMLHPESLEYVNDPRFPATELYPNMYENYILEKLSGEQYCFGLGESANNTLIPDKSQQHGDGSTVGASQYDINCYVYPNSLNTSTMGQTTPNSNTNDQLLPMSESMEMMNHFPSVLEEMRYENISQSSLSSDDLDPTLIPSFEEWNAKEVT